MIETLRNSDTAYAGTTKSSFEISLAQVILEPILSRALAMAQQGHNREFQATALLTVARRLAARRSPAAVAHERRAGG
jgi:hypothetical protein